MSLDYNLNLSSNLTPSQICALLPKLDGRVKAADTPELLTGPGVTISVLNEPDLSREIIRERFGLEIAQQVNFRLDKFGAFDDGVRTAVEVSLKILTSTNSEGILFADHQTPVLMRKDGRITLDPGPGFWPGLPSLVGQPYVLGRL